MQRIPFVVVLWVASIYEAGPVYADKWWPLAPSEHFSDDHFFRFVITPQDPLPLPPPLPLPQREPRERERERASCTGALQRWDSRSPGKYQPVWARALVNDDAPVEVVVDSTGRFVATFDNWYATGYGSNAVVVYGPDGAVVRSLSLLDLLLPAEIARLSMSVGSVRWLESARFEGATDRRLLEIQVRQAASDGTPTASIALRLDPITGSALRSDADLEKIAEQRVLCQTLPASDSSIEWKACLAKATSDVWCALCRRLRADPVRQVRAATPANLEGQPLDSPEWSALGVVTGFHSVSLKKAGLEARLVEADGSASVARDPVSLYLIVTNGTADLVQRIWRVPRTVERIRKVSAAACGVDVAVDVDDQDTDDPVVHTVRETLRLCFLSSDRKLEPLLKIAELPQAPQ